MDTRETSPSVLLRYREAAADLHARLERRCAAGLPHDRLQARLDALLQRSAQTLAARDAAVLRLDYPPQLPVCQRHDEIIGAVERHQVLILCGETGSGKSTQLPKMCLELGRGRLGRIGHTLPRRIAARSLAAQLADELGTPLGHGVGYKVRFDDRTGPATRLKLMTDGLLLSEIRADPLLLEYDTLILDEAHERSLNIDFLLGYLHRLLPRRPDLKLVITSATLDATRIASHFGNAPVLQVSGRRHAVELRYRPLKDQDSDEPDLDLNEGIGAAVDELSTEDRGDILVFLPGEREIREAGDALRKRLPPQVEILPLLARQPHAAQQHIFSPGRARRIILATNVAESALTVPRVRHVVDSGLVRISRYSARSRLRRLPIEAVSQAGAIQRAGRCGRLAPGVCIRLYGEDDYLARPAFTDPEIQRTDLAAVVLQMCHLGLGDPLEFPFVDPPQARQVRGAWQQLRELGAVDEEQQLTDIGRQLAQLSVDPALGRILLEAARLGCLDAACTLVAGLAIPDPRERPVDARDAADRAHREFSDPRSDFLGLLNLWHAWRRAADGRNRSQLQAWCRDRYVSALRMREWAEVRRQVADELRELGYRPEPATATPGYTALHRALISGLLRQTGRRAGEREYIGPHGTRFHLFPGSTLYRQPRKWIVAAEVVETSRRFARMVAEIRPEWIEQAAPALLRSEFYEPYWEPRRGRVMAYQRSDLFGLRVVERRRVHFGPHDPVQAREILIRAGLVEGQLPVESASLRATREACARLERLQARLRCPLRVDDDQLYALFDQRLPPHIYTAEALRDWLLRAERAGEPALRLPEQALRLPDSAADRLTGADDFPDLLALGPFSAPLHYRFAPGEPDDGVTARVPVAALAQVEAWRGDWLVPGLLGERLVALGRALPKALRHRLVPVPDSMARLLARLEFATEPLPAALSAAARAVFGIEVPEPGWALDQLPEHLRLRYELVDADDQVIAAGRDLAALRTAHGAAAGRGFADLDLARYERRPVTRWDFGDLPERIEVASIAGARVHAWPALVYEGPQFAVRLYQAPQPATAAHRRGVQELLVRSLRRRSPGALPASRDLGDLGLLYLPLGAATDLEADLHAAILGAAGLDAGVPRTQHAWQQTLERVQQQVEPARDRVIGQTREILLAWRELRRALRGGLPLGLAEAAADLGEQLERLIHPGFISATPPAQLAELPRYLRAMALRLERARRDPARDRERVARVRHWSEAYWSQPPQQRELPQWQAFRWLLEELRVATFAQELGTREPVSEQRLRHRWRELAA